MIFRYRRSKRGIEDDEGDLIPSVLEMGWRKRNEPRSEVVMKDIQGPEGMKVGELIIAGSPLETAKNPHGGSRLRWNWAIDMGVEADR